MPWWAGCRDWKCDAADRTKRRTPKNGDRAPRTYRLADAEQQSVSDPYEDAGA